MEGTAGELLGLLAFYERFGGKDVLNRAILCGDKLLKSRVQSGGYRAWTNDMIDETIPTAGCAHGTSGISYALARLASNTNDSRYAKAAREGITFEDNSNTELVDWKSIHKGAKMIPEWCLGHAGLGIARIAVGEYLNDDQIRSSGRDQLMKAASLEPNSIDGLCCGNLERVDSLPLTRELLEEEIGHPEWLTGLCLARRDRGENLI